MASFIEVSSSSGISHWIVFDKICFITVNFEQQEDLVVRVSFVGRSDCLELHGGGAAALLNAFRERS